MTQFRFIHAADIHLDSPLRGLAGQEGAAAERIRSATRDAFDNLVGLSIEQEAAFVIIAGDLYDGDWRDYKTGLFFVSQMGRLHKSGIPVFVSYGNHDAESQITRRLVLPDNVNVFPSKTPKTFELEELGVALHGQSFSQRDITENLALGYPSPVPSRFNIGVLHTGVGGMGGHENYAPCSLNDLVHKGYDYWALGHVHQAQVLHERPHVVFSGNLQGRHVRELGPKGASLVSVEGREVVDITSLDADVVRWAVLPVAMDGATSFNNATAKVQRALEQAVADQADGRLLACRIALRGRSPVHEQLMASEAQLLAELRAGALGLGEEVAWVEKVVIETEPEVDAEILAEREDAIGDLRRMLELAATDEELLRQLGDDVGEIARRLPHEARGEVTDTVLRAAIEDDYAALIDRVIPYLTARLMAEGE